MPMALPPESCTISAAVVRMAMAMPTMPKMLPRIEVVGWDRPFRAWMKQTLATRYSSVTTFIDMSVALRLAGAAGGGLLVLLLEHLQHAARHQEAAEDVHRRQGDGEHAHGLAERRFGERRSEHGAHDDDGG